MENQCINLTFFQGSLKHKRPPSGAKKSSMGIDNPAPLGIMMAEEEAISPRFFMIKHIVLWKLKEDEGGWSKQENAFELKRRLEALKNKIPDILELEIGFPIEKGETVSDVALYSLFKDKEGLEAYQKHQEHQKVVEFVRQIAVERRVVDYEI
jgi:Stress responsive A/B Barrel Domain